MFSHGCIGRSKGVTHIQFGLSNIHQTSFSCFLLGSRSEFQPQDKRIALISFNTILILSFRAFVSKKISKSPEISGPQFQPQSFFPRKIKNTQQALKCVSIIKKSAGQLSASMLLNYGLVERLSIISGLIIKGVISSNRGSWGVSEDTYLNEDHRGRPNNLGIWDPDEPQDLWKSLQEYSEQKVVVWIIVEVISSSKNTNQSCWSGALNIFNGHSEALLTLSIYNFSPKKNKKLGQGKYPPKKICQTEPISLENVLHEFLFLGLEGPGCSGKVHDLQCWTNVYLGLAHLRPGSSSLGLPGLQNKNSAKLLTFMIFSQFGTFFFFLAEDAQFPSFLTLAIFTHFSHPNNSAFILGNCKCFQCLPLQGISQYYLSIELIDTLFHCLKVSKGFGLTFAFCGRGFGFGGLSGYWRRIGQTRVVSEGAAGSKMGRQSAKGSRGCTVGGLRNKADAGTVKSGRYYREWKSVGIQGCGNSMGAGTGGRGRVVGGELREFWGKNQESSFIITKRQTIHSLFPGRNVQRAVTRKYLLLGIKEDTHQSRSFLQTKGYSIHIGEGLSVTETFFLSTAVWNYSKGMKPKGTQQTLEKDTQLPTETTCFQMIKHYFQCILWGLKIKYNEGTFKVRQNHEKPGKQNYKWEIRINIRYGDIFSVSETSMIESLTQKFINAGIFKMHLMPSFHKNEQLPNPASTELKKAENVSSIIKVILKDISSIIQINPSKLTSAVFSSKKIQTLATTCDEGLHLMILGQTVQIILVAFKFSHLFFIFFLKFFLFLQLQHGRNLVWCFRFVWDYHKSGPTKGQVCWPCLAEAKGVPHTYQKPMLLVQVRPWGGGG
ncbi:hypothetical protein VP01_972g4 [Puccinia sorghi]|uniref:Uncharacterized protein n=1 Tax=Puccinia sorghi TaxID=27349 RepID=A0A0L6U5X0_9BASI|nr:hypothetical protein VP01_972g4 [Puccinia sorghi]